MTLQLTANSERVIADYLREHPDVAAITDRIVSKTPTKTDTPWVRYTLLNERSIGGHRSDHLREAFVQLEAYAGKDGFSAHAGQPGASLLARTVRAAMMAMPEESHDDAVVTGVEPRGYSRIPDTQLDNRERYIAQFAVWLRND